MYQSPISIYESAMQTIMEQRENAIFAKVQDAFDVQVDKAELIRALQYDRGQYEKGYQDAKQEQRWIPVERRLPEADKNVLVCTIHGSFKVARCNFYKNGTEASWATNDGLGERAITHWMPLPEPPKEGE